MILSGDYHVEISPAKLRRMLLNPEKLRNCLPHCVGIKMLEPDYYRVTFQIRAQGERYDSLLQLKPDGEGGGHEEQGLCMNFISERDDSLYRSSRSVLAFTANELNTTLSHRTKIEINAEKGQESLGETRSAIIQVIDQFADNLKSEGGKMTNKQQDFDQLLGKAEDPIMELEHEAEEAAARGFLGGPYVWGLFILILLCVGLLIFFR